MIGYTKKENQQIQYLFNNKFVENKPVPFPQFGKKYNYSNIFYWAHLEAKETGEFPLHPHEGFEIMTFVLEGYVEHFDTASNVWTPIQAGGFQVIQSGSGLQHSEKIVKDSALFQIWFDPDFSKSLQTKPDYKDYTKEAIKSQIIDGIETYEYIGDSAVFHQTEDIRVSKEIYPVGRHSISLDRNYIYSIYLISGIATINSKVSNKDDFIVCEDEEELSIEVKETTELFVLKTPKEISYKTRI